MNLNVLRLADSVRDAADVLELAKRREKQIEAGGAAYAGWEHGRASYERREAEKAYTQALETYFEATLETFEAADTIPTMKAGEAAE